MVNERASHTAPPWIDALAAAVAERLAQSPSALRHITEMEEELLTLDQVKQRLGVRRDETVRRLIQTGGLPMFKMPGSKSWVITRKAYRQAMQRQFRPLKRASRQIPPHK